MLWGSAQVAEATRGAVAVHPARAARGCVGARLRLGRPARVRDHAPGAAPAPASARRPPRQHHPEHDDRPGDRRARAPRIGRAPGGAADRSAADRPRRDPFVRDLRRGDGDLLHHLVPAHAACGLPREAARSRANRVSPVPAEAPEITEMVNAQMPLGATLGIKTFGGPRRSRRRSRGHPSSARREASYTAECSWRSPTPQEQSAHSSISRLAAARSRSSRRRTSSAQCARARYERGPAPCIAEGRRSLSRPTSTTRQAAISDARPRRRRC